MQDLGSQPRIQPLSPCIAIAESYPLGCQGSPLCCTFLQTMARAMHSQADPPLPSQLGSWYPLLMSSAFSLNLSILVSLYKTSNSSTPVTTHRAPVFQGRSNHFLSSMVAKTKQNTNQEIKISKFREMRIK